MGLVTRYFATAGAGTEDGTTWANRAPLIVSSAWNNIIRNFTFTAGSDSLECRVGSGTYTCPILEAATFTAGSPTRAKCLFFVGVSSKDGIILEPPNPNWSSAQPIWDTTNMPVLDFGANTLNHSHVHSFMIRFQNSNTGGFNTNTGVACVFTWCEIVASGTNTGGICARGEASNCVIRCTSANYADGFLPGTNGMTFNVRFEGNSAAVGGARRGFRSYANSSQFYSHCTSIDNVDGFLHDRHVVNAISRLYRCLSYGNGGDGAATANTTTLTSGFQQQIVNSVFVNNSLFGVDYAQNPTLITGCRLRNNTSGNFSTTTITNGIELYNDLSAGSDADEFVDHTNKDFRIKNTSTLWGKGYGPADEPAQEETRIWFG